MEQRLFAFSLIIEGTTEKVLNLTMPLKSMNNQNLGLIEQKCIFEHYREDQTIKNILTDIIFALKIFFLMTFSELPPKRLMLLLHKNAVFHWVSL